MVRKQMSAWWTVVLVVVLVCVGTGVGQTVQECTQALTGMVSCLDYVSANRTSPPPDKPTQACCMGLANTVKTQPRCLCLLLNNGGAQFGLKINLTRSLDLPKQCSVQTPPVSDCNNNGPAMAPNASPSPTSPPGSKASPSSGYTTPTMNIGVFAAIIVVFFIASADFIKIF